jgi:transposase-like protein
MGTPGTTPGKEGSTAVKKQSTEGTKASSVVWEGLEAYIRTQIEATVQRLLEEEVTERLGREKSERRSQVDPEEGSRNGHGKPRKLSTSAGTVTVRRPRVRGLSERFESRVLPVFKKHTKEVGALLPELYLHGLAEGDFDMALRGLLGEAAPLSASSVARLKATWQTEYDEWRRRSLADLEVVYLWVDGVYVKAGLEKEKAAVLVALGGLRDGRKVVLAVEPGVRESSEAWSAVLRDLRDRGMTAPKLAIGDGHLGFWGALTNVFPETQEQRCWNHRIVNVLDKVPKKQQRQAKLVLTEIPYAPTKKEAERLKGVFQAWCDKKGCAAAGELLDKDWDRMVAFYGFPSEHWKHLRTTNPIESPFAAVRLRTTAAKRYKKVENATAVIWKTLLVAEKSFRRLNAAHLLAEVAEGATYVDGARVRKDLVRKEAA